MMFFPLYLLFEKYSGELLFIRCQERSAKCRKYYYTLMGEFAVRFFLRAGRLFYLQIKTDYVFSQSAVIGLRGRYFLCG